MRLIKDRMGLIFTVILVLSVGLLPNVSAAGVWKPPYKKGSSCKHPWRAEYWSHSDRVSTGNLSKIGFKRKKRLEPGEPDRLDWRVKKPHLKICGVWRYSQSGKWIKLPTGPRSGTFTWHHEPGTEDPFSFIRIDARNA